MTDANDPSATPTDTATEAFTMSSITGKLVLAMVRGQDYAHAGEEEAIELVLGPIPKMADARLLDVGCGIGGTARYVETHGWGTVTGVDLDPANIAAANERHPGMDFVSSDAVLLAQAVPAHFDIIYSFNAFFLFNDQPAALRAMRAVARPAGKLAIFDYVDLGGYVDSAKPRSTASARDALRLDLIGATLEGSGWSLDQIVPAHTEYLRWYETLVGSIESKRDEIIAQSSEGFFDYVLERYTQTRDDIQAGRLGGATIYAAAT